LASSFARLSVSIGAKNRTTVVAVGNQGTDTDNRMVDVLGELVAHGSADFVISFADMGLAAP
jgi:hypothetical protein